jgi:outer membrane protein TolC
LSKVQISEVQLQQAHEAVSIARTRYETGSVTNLDLLDAETAESSARLMNLQALYRFVISKYELSRAVGASFSN